MTVLFLPFKFGFHLFVCLFVCLSIYPIAVARTSNTILNKSGWSGHPRLVPDLRGNAFSFSSLTMILAVGLSYMGFLFDIFVWFWYQGDGGLTE